MRKKLSIVKLSKDEYMVLHGAQYHDGELFDYPLEEIHHILDDTDITEVALIGDRLYELP